MSGRGLHPVYVALDGHQYSRAVKLCQGLDPSNILGRALLAHAYAKSGQRFKSLLTISSIFGEDDCFPELQMAIRYEYVATPEQMGSKTGESSAQSKKQTPVSSKKPTKKGKKKGSGNASATTSSTGGPPKAPLALPTLEEWDLIDRLDTPPRLPDDWETRLPGTSIEAEATLLSTLASTMATQLRLPLTAYQLYCWAVSNPPDSTKRDREEEIHNAKKVFQYGLALLLHQQYAHITPVILAQLQTRALQISKLQQSQQVSDTVPATLWAAQTALWRIQFSPPTDSNLAMLPRLAESLALKAHQQATTATEQSHHELCVSESFLLYLRALEEQNKWSDMWTALTTMTTSQQQEAEWLQMKRIFVLEQMGEKQDEIVELSASLVRQNPDDWAFWISHWKACQNATDGEATVKIHQLIDQCVEEEGKRTLRAPRLMRVELSAARNDGSFVSSIIAYGNELASRSMSSFSDLERYFEKLDVEESRAVLDWSHSLLEAVDCSADSSGERQKSLKMYIFGAYVNFKIVSLFVDEFRARLLDWQVLMQVWNAYRRYEEEAKLGQAQKEQRPPDALVLLAVQRILFESTETKDKILAATLLEAAMQYSPDNAYLKLSAIRLYADLDAPSRSYQLYNDLFIKHIQNESCSYVILPYLLRGGLFSEAIAVCHSIENFQRASNRETSEFIMKAMQFGSMAKAQEFLVFQKEKLQSSVTSTEAKSLILDLAPLVGEEGSGDIGGAQGLVGGDNDIERVERMIAETYNPRSPFRLFQLDLSKPSSFADNRDQTIFDFDVLGRHVFESAPQILQRCHVRCHQHGLLIRMSLCVMAASAPKKGKVPKTSLIAERRCTSLLEASNAASSFAECDPHSIHADVLQVIVTFCQFVTTVVGGRSGESAPSADDLGAREHAACDLMNGALAAVRLLQPKLSEVSTVGETSLLLQECFTPLYCCFMVCAKLADVFGWGRRKRKTKPCAASLAEFAAEFAKIAIVLKDKSEVPNFEDIYIGEITQLTGEFLHGSLVEQTIDAVRAGQERTSTQISSYYQNIEMKLEKFNCDD